MACLCVLLYCVMAVYSISDAGVRHLVDGVVLYCVMAVCRISDAGVRHLVDGPCSAKLRELNLTNCIRVGDMAMVNIHKRLLIQFFSCHAQMLAYFSKRELF